MWVWTSTPPGMTYRSVASISTSAWTGIPTPIAATRSSSTTTSAFVVSVAVTIVPPLMRVLMAFDLLPVFLAGFWPGSWPCCVAVVRSGHHATVLCGGQTGGVAMGTSPDEHLGPERTTCVRSL